MNFSILSPELQEILLPLKIIFLALSWLFLCLIFWGLFKTSWLKEALLMDLIHFFTCRPYGAKRLAKIWVKIQKRVEKGSAADLKLAIIEADKILDETLKRKGLAGETLGDRLKQLKPDIVDLDSIWQAHKVRNNIVHDPDFKLDKAEAQKILTIYEKTFRGLEAF